MLLHLLRLLTADWHLCGKWHSRGSFNYWGPSGGNMINLIRITRLNPKTMRLHPILLPGPLALPKTKAAMIAETKRRHDHQSFTKIYLPTRSQDWRDNTVYFLVSIFYSMWYWAWGRTQGIQLRFRRHMVQTMAAAQALDSRARKVNISLLNISLLF